MSSVVSHKKFDATHQESYYAFRKQVEIKIDELKPDDFVSGIMLIIKKVDGGTEIDGAIQLFDAYSTQIIDHLMKTLADIKAKLAN